MTAQEKRDLYMRKYNENKDYVDARIAEGIEKNRKGNCKVKFVDNEGKPIVGKKIKVTQKTHDFKHGANIFLLDEFKEDDLNTEYRRMFKENFNLATLPFYWNTLEPEEGKPRYAKDSPKIYRRPAPDLCMEYCEANGVTPKLHCLFYENFNPDWLVGRTEGEAMALLEKRFCEISERYAGRMFEFEVTNELFITRARKTALGGKRNIANICFDIAKKYFPNDKLTINEAGQLPSIAKLDYYNPYFLQCESLLKSGVPIDRIGLQCHLFTGKRAHNEEEYLKSVRDPAGLVYNDPMMYFKALDVMGEFGLPLEITEVTVPTFGDTIEDEQLQADMLKLWYSVWFSHPAVDTVVYWNTADGYAYVSNVNNENNCRGGIFHKNLTPKLAGIMQKQLFDEIWHTETAIETNSDGCIEFRGFYGDYQAELDGRLMDFGMHKETDTTNNITLKYHT